MGEFLDRVRINMLDPYPDLFRLEEPTPPYERLSTRIAKNQLPEPHLSIIDGVFIIRLGDGSRVLHEIGHILYRPPERYFRLDVKNVNFNYALPKGFRGIMGVMRNELGPFSVQEVLTSEFRQGHHGQPVNTGRKYIGQILDHMSAWRDTRLPLEYFTQIDVAALDDEYRYVLIQPPHVLMARWRQQCELLRRHVVALRLAAARITKIVARNS
jgi:hypothetical protein